MKDYPLDKRDGQEETAFFFAFRWGCNIVVLNHEEKNLGKLEKNMCL